MALGANWQEERPPNTVLVAGTLCLHPSPIFFFGRDR